MLDLLSRAHFKKQNYLRVIEILEALIKVQPENTTVLYRLAASCYNLQEFRRTIEYTGRILEIDPGDRFARQDLKRITHSSGNDHPRR